ncbi:pimeloyl-ACP methyl ester carboxylesterase [Paucimonas lemoignei]|uniref:Pimeloyl-ACP methyl ester carboxylesterase n=1 Tax=Paucimonas lemoignei TaxID=29443 RepID=A0A4V2UIT5_PAULE|nr:alpha/beta hydrolase [Paucimonas lemoignei]TCS37420.1 pimeloyl-ACP methyl ester carboxylesterase [Paucimonas lemoignei]
MPTLRVNGIDLYYEEQGSGAPLVMVPGLGGTVESWRAQIAHFKHRYRVIALDNRGSGRSSMPPGPYTMDDMAADLAGLLDALDITEPVRLVGVSMGGVLVQCFIHHYPERVAQLALVSTGVSGGDPRITFPSLAVLQKLAFPGATPRQRLQTLFSLYFHPRYLEAHPEVFDEAIQLYARIGAQPDHATRAQLQAVQDTRPYYKWLAKINVPVLVMHGEDDVVWPVKNAHTLVKGIGDNAELALFKEAGHVLFQEKQAEFNACLERFLEQGVAQA